MMVNGKFIGLDGKVGSSGQEYLKHLKDECYSLLFELIDDNCIF
jgi:hypothetical protein